MSRRPTTRGLLLSVLSVLLTMSGCGGGEQVEPPPVARPISTMVVGGMSGGRLTFPGTTQAADRAELSFRVAGPLIEFPVNEGDEVARGQLLARIDPRDYRIALAETKAANDQAEADAQRYRRLYEREAVPLADLELATARRDVARARHEQAQADFRDTELRAPFAGQVGIKYVENFEDVLAKAPVLSLHNVGQVEIVINVPESIMATVREGMSPTIVTTFDVAPNRSYPMRIKEFSVAADPATQTFPITFTMPQPADLNVLPGMTALVIVSDIQLDEDESVPITVPAHAVFSDASGAAQVWVIDTQSQTVHRRGVRVGPVTGTQSIVVLDGLTPGETIAVAGIYQLEEGQQIRLMDG
ncbi:MAG: efflux RND transporter periplasmic adaptor subunit [Gemmatimonadetes bacterium]|nr:efflux RND transporter periplasmic adaptor subunit [Gemmatimonadota bacterium]